MSLNHDPRKYANYFEQIASSLEGPLMSPVGSHRIIVHEGSQGGVASKPRGAQGRVHRVGGLHNAGVGSERVTEGDTRVLHRGEMRDKGSGPVSPLQPWEECEGARA